ncbi:glycosyl hydrolase family 28-related protein [Gorillibacterium sp. sgz5001074]|uniref:glycosyl hydrolase family 28-related protein n=1 Tax=Gorillibacterium sp. sgz5001074 TaxID=3446695 RepID=UPI003F67FB95
MQWNSLTKRLGIYAAVAGILSVMAPTPSAHAAGINIWIEAESAVQLKAPIQADTDANASGGTYIWAVNGSAEGGYADYAVEVPADGDYMFWGRTLFPNSNDDSFFLSFDGGEDAYYWGSAGSSWQWRKHPGTAFTLTAGTHTLRIKKREDGAKLDKFLLTTDASYTPSGLGGGERKPYLGAPFTSPAVIEAEHYDLGGEGVAYHDNSTNNEGGNTFRTQEGVDIGTGAWGYHLGWTKAGEWTEYTLNAETAGTYALQVRYASKVSGAAHVEIDGVNVTGKISTNTGDWTKWTYTPEKTFPLTAGSHKLRLVMDTESGGNVGNFDHFLFYKTPLFDPSDDKTPPQTPSDVTVRTGNGLADVTWSGNTEADLAGYYVYLNGVKQNLFYQKTTSYTAKNLAYGQPYTLQVTAVDKAGNESALSSDVKYATLPYVDVTKAPYYAKGDGLTDDTAALQKALSENTGKNALVYLPNGTYLVSNTLTWSSYVKEAKRMVVQGESREGTVIKLKDQTPSFMDPAAPKAVISPYSGPGGVAGSASNDEINYQAFMNALIDVTVDTGAGNPGAVGIEWTNHNEGGIRNVTIRSGDPSGTGVAGIDLSKPWEGPGLIKNVSIDGFDVGIKGRNTTYSMVFENITLRNQKLAGIDNSAYIMSIRGLTSHNAVPVLHQHDSNDGMITLVDAVLSGGGSDTAALVNDAGQLFVRNVRAEGYSSVIRDKGAEVPGLTVKEYVAGGVYSLFPTALQSLNLPIEDAPKLGYSSPKAIMEHGANVKDFKRPGDPDDTLSIQRAIDSGASIVYFPTRSTYTISDTIHIRGNVQQITAFESTFDVSNAADFAEKPVFRFEGTQPAVLLERFAAQRENTNVHWWMENASSGTVAFRNIFFTDGKTYRSTVPGGKVFVENVAGTGWFFNNQSVWARQLNPESGTTKVTNDGGKLWILGLKTEKKGTNLATYNGGFSEVLGGLMYPASGNGVMDQPAFINHESSMSIIVGEEKGTSASQGHYPLWVTETRNGETRSLKDTDLPVRIVGTMIPLYAGIRDNEPPVTQVRLEGTEKSGWYVSDVSAVLEASDNSGAAVGTFYSTDDGASWSLYGEPVAFTQDGRYRLQYRSEDPAGNREQARSAAFGIDRTAPAVRIMADGTPLTAGKVWGAEGTVTLSVYTEDADSGVASVLTLLDGKPADLSKPLALWQLPGVHTLTVQSTDQAGNTANIAVNLRVAVTVDSVKALIDRLSASGQMGKAVALILKQQLDQIARFLERGDVQKALQEILKLAGRLAEHHPSPNAAPLTMSEDASRLLKAYMDQLGQRE